MFFEEKKQRYLIDATDPRKAMEEFAEIGAGSSIAFEFSAQVIRDGQVVDEVPMQHNLVLDQGLEYFCSASINSGTKFLQVGTSQIVPTTSDTALGRYLAGIEINLLAATETRSLGSGTIDTTGYVPPYCQFTNTVTFNAGALGAIAVNVAELGLGRQLADGLISTRALLTDASGNPTTLSVLPTDQLRVTYSMRIYQDMHMYTFTGLTLDEWTGDLTVCAALVTTSSSECYSAGYTSSCKARSGVPFYTTGGDYPVNCFSGSGSFGEVGADPTGTNSGNASIGGPTVTEYVANSRQGTAYISGSISQWNVTFHTLRAPVGGSPWKWKFGFSPAVPKTNLQTWKFGITFTLSRYVQL